MLINMEFNTASAFMAFDETTRVFNVMGDKLSEKYTGLHLLKVYMSYERSEYDFWFH